MAVTTGGTRVGGVCGAVQNGSLTACSFTGDVSGSGNGDAVGGVCGVSGGTVTACYYKSGTVYGGNARGGVCGRSNSAGEIIACYSTGTVNGSGGIDVGDIVGKHDATVTDCYYTGAAGTGQGGAGTDITTLFGAAPAWPTTVTNTNWGLIGNTDGDSEYWKDLGNWNGGTNPVYPTLWWER